ALHAAGCQLPRLRLHAAAGLRSHHLTGLLHGGDRLQREPMLRLRAGVVCPCRCPRQSRAKVKRAMNDLTPFDVASNRHPSTDRLTSLLADFGDIPVVTDPTVVRRRSRDFFWYSPVLNDQ